MIKINVQKLFNKIDTKLMGDQRLMKLLKYDTSDALKKEKLTNTEINELFNNEKNKTENKIIKNSKRVFHQESNPELLEEMRSEIRIHPKFIPQNGLIKTLVFFEVIVHKDIEELDNGKNRSIEITKEIYKSLRNCHSIGRLNFDNNPTIPMHFGKNLYYGYIFYGVTRLSGRW